MSTKSTYQRLNQGAARIMFIMGLGLGAVILGAVLSVGLSMRLAPRLHGLPLPVLHVLDLLIRNLWCLLILPLFVYAAARVTELRVWSTALGSLLTGSSFLLMLAYLQRGGGGVWRSTWDFVSWVLVLGMSTLWIRRAVLKGAQYREAQEQKAKVKAAAKVSEYDAFLAEAAALGDRQAAREAEGVQAPLASTGTDGATSEASSGTASPMDGASADSAPGEELPSGERASPEDRGAPSDSASTETAAAASGEVREPGPDADAPTR